MRVFDKISHICERRETDSVFHRMDNIIKVLSTVDNGIMTMISSAIEFLQNKNDYRDKTILDRFENLKMNYEQTETRYYVFVSIFSDMSNSLRTEWEEKIYEDTKLIYTN